MTPLRTPEHPPTSLHPHRFPPPDPVTVFTPRHSSSTASHMCIRPIMPVTALQTAGRLDDGVPPRLSLDVAATPPLSQRRPARPGPAQLGAARRLEPRPDVRPHAAAAPVVDLSLHGMTLCSAHHHLLSTRRWRLGLSTAP